MQSATRLTKIAAQRVAPRVPKRFSTTGKPDGSHLPQDMKGKSEAEIKRWLAKQAAEAQEHAKKATEAAQQAQKAAEAAQKAANQGTKPANSTPKSSDGSCVIS